MKLYSFYWDVGRTGSITGLFTTDDIAELYGRGIDFGECLGKHSQVYGTLEAEDFTLISQDPAEVAVFEKLFPQGFGYSPLEYLDDADDD